jgi:hypothetical protein
MDKDISVVKVDVLVELFQGVIDETRLMSHEKAEKV